MNTHCQWLSPELWYNIMKQVPREVQVEGSCMSYTGNVLLNLFKMGEEKNKDTEDDLPAQQGTGSTMSLNLDFL